MRADTHLFPLADGWALWRWVCVRGAGFPADLVLRLGAPELAECADAWLAEEQRVREVCDRAIAACERALAPLVGEPRKALVRALKRLRQGLAPEGSLAGLERAAPLAAALEAAARALGERSAALEALGRRLGDERARIADELRELARDSRFREAVVWQNRAALHTAIEPLLRQPRGATDSKTRQHEWAVASYLQRYCVKNDAIGFFGPIGWGALAPAGEPVEVRPGRELVARRTVYFEHWGVEALGATLAADPALRPDLPPRRMPTVWVEGTRLHHPIDRTSEIAPVFARLLAACDGERTARAIAEELLGDRALEIEGADEVYELLGQLVEQKLVVWGAEIPVHAAHPEKELRRLVERARDPEARQRALGAVAELEERRAAVSAAAGDVDRLDGALGALEETFTRLTGSAGTRRGGQMYAGRTLVYEDCLRDLDLRVGPGLLGPLAGPLALLLRSARWYTFEIARRYRARLDAIYRDLRAQTGSAVLDYLRFWEAAAGLFSGDHWTAPPLVEAVLAEFQARWARLLEIPPDAKEIVRASASLEQSVGELFAAPGPGWPAARHHSPDLLVAARDRAALCGEEPLFVLGELHTGEATPATPFVVRHHDDPAALVRARDLDCPEPAIAPVVPKDRATRADASSLSEKDFDLEVGTSRSWRARSRVVAIGELVIEETPAGLVVRTREGRLRFDIIQFLEQFLAVESAAHFALLAPGGHGPRVRLDRLVVQRERWSFRPDEMPFSEESAAGADPARRFLAVRSWARRHGLPRFLFLKIPEERKPVYVDLASPLYLELLARLCRKASALSLTEMLPRVDECWLEDAAGKRYTCELRLAAVDPEPWRPPAPEPR